uniref:Uncharacterized protein n=1 Tax=Arundo donax TaxID=35708 RepID=A0A0A9GM96_ARUDO
MQCFTQIPVPWSIVWWYVGTSCQLSTPMNMALKTLLLCVDLLSFCLITAGIKLPYFLSSI